MTEDDKSAKDESNAAAEAAPSAATPQKSAPGPRRSIVSVASETIRYIERAEKDKTLHVRTDDKKSAIFMALSLVIGIGFTVLYMVNESTRQLCIVMALVADGFLGLAILWYVLLRFGVLRTVEPRHALLCWQLMLGAGVLFAFYTMNIAFAFFTIYSSSAAAASATAPATGGM